MSYADKHPHEAQCVAPNCPFNGTKLILIKDKPYWTCERHYEEMSARVGL